MEIMIRVHPGLKKSTFSIQSPLLDSTGIIHVDSMLRGYQCTLILFFNKKSVTITPQKGAK